ncbi:MAG: response regulator transcription factor [Acidobacteria bacterium]|nr:response regulator transcription factor [Acidobacteriota bacterium]
MVVDKPRILVVDDEQQVLRLIKLNLSSEGYYVKVTTNGSEALRLIKKQIPDLVLLDLMMPGMSGFDTCKAIRQYSNVPIIIISARQSDSHKITALDLGADDYITKPFSIIELLARIRTVLRRASVCGVEESFLTVDDITIDTLNKQVFISGKQINLTPTEYITFKYLVSNKGKALSLESLIQHIWGKQSPNRAVSLRVVINNLRLKIELDPQDPQRILTQHCFGYKYG